MDSGEQGLESLVGQSIAGYRLERILGTGLTGGVYLGRRIEDAPRLIERTQAAPIVLPDEAAVKLLVLPLQLSAQDREDFRKRFLREAETLQRLRHAHILSVVASGDDNGHLYMILPYLSGGTLADTLATAESLPLERVSTLLAQLADALDYAHAQGVIHRDIKPANVLLDGDGNAYLGDFSIARLQEVQTKHTTTGKIMGTFTYMAPEQARGSEVTAAADIYSLGCVVYQLVTGAPPFTGADLPRLILQHVQDQPPAPRARRPELPEPAEAAILRALAKDPAERFATATEFTKAFSDGLHDRWAAGLTAYVPGAKAAAAASAAHNATTAAAGLGAPLPRKRGRQRVGVLMAVGLALACVVLIVGVAGSGLGLFGSAFALFASGHATPIGTQAGGGTQTTGTETATGTTVAKATSTTGKGGGGGGGGRGTPTTMPSGRPTATPIPPTPTPLPTFVISADALQSSDGVAHGPSNPYIFTSRELC